MWLINTTTLLLESVQKCPTNLYAILSHTWGSDAEELDFTEFKAGQGRQKKGFEKIRLCCEQAWKDGLEYAWVDTCCIDKRSSTELTEAINSMFSWYASANVCYVYLADIHQHDLVGGREDQRSFQHSRWFTRGWTLQELIAPHDVVFYTHDWTKIGDKSDLAEKLHATTGIDLQVLGSGKDMRNCSVAQRMSWASGRETTRLEDRAYCLLGLFNVNMPLLYGEGSKAFLRLQEAIISDSDDETIFSWTAVDEGGSGLLAPDPKHFSDCSNVQQRNPNSANVRQGESYRDRAPYTKTNRGLSIQCQMLPCGMNTYVVPLRCERTREGLEPQQIGIFLCRTLEDSQYRRVSFRGTPTDEVTSWDISKAKTSTIYVPNDGSGVELAPRELPLIYIKSKLHAWRFDGAIVHEPLTSPLDATNVVDPMSTHGRAQNEDVEAAGSDTDRRKPKKVTQVQLQSRNLEKGMFIAFTRSAISEAMFYYYLEFGFDMDFNPVCTLFTRPFWLEGSAPLLARLRHYKPFQFVTMVSIILLSWGSIVAMIVSRFHFALLLFYICFVAPWGWCVLKWTRRQLSVCESLWIAEICTHTEYHVMKNGLVTKGNCVACRSGNTESWLPIVIDQSSVLSDDRSSRIKSRYGWRKEGHRFRGLELHIYGTLPAANGCVIPKLDFRPLGNSSWELELREVPSHSGWSHQGGLCWRRRFRTLAAITTYPTRLILSCFMPLTLLPTFLIGIKYFAHLFNISKGAGIGLCALIWIPPLCWTLIGVVISRHSFSPSNIISEPT